MTLSTVLEVALGLALIYYILSLIVSYVTSEIAKWTEMRAKDLKEGLRELLEDSGKLQDLMDHPSIQMLKPKRLKLLRGGIKIYDVDEIPSTTFALTLVNMLDPTGAGQGTLDDFRSAIQALPDGNTKKALLGLVNSGVKNVDEFRGRVEGWFDTAMAGVSSLYKQHARRIAVIIALVVTVVTGVDSIQVTKSLWQEPAIRATMAVKVDEFLQEEKPEGDVQTYIGTLKELKIPILWSGDAWPQNPIDWAWKGLGLALTWVAVAQGSSFWYQILKQIRSATTSSSPPKTNGSEAGAP